MRAMTKEAMRGYIALRGSLLPRAPARPLLPIIDMTDNHDNNNGTTNKHNNNDISNEPTNIINKRPRDRGDEIKKYLGGHY